MAQLRTSMRKTREILRLHFLGLKQRPKLFPDTEHRKCMPAGGESGWGRLAGGSRLGLFEVRKRTIRRTCFRSGPPRSFVLLRIGYQAMVSAERALEEKRGFEAIDSYEDFVGFQRCVRRSLERGDKVRDSRAKSRRTCQAVANEPYVLLAKAAADSVGSSSRAAHISAR